MCVREHRAGSPAGPQVSADIVCVRYMYDGGKMSQGRLCRLTPSHHEKVTGQEVLDVLAEDGVDLARFYACVYESVVSGGSWLRVGSDGSELSIPLAPIAADGSSVARRVDVKLFRETAMCVDAARAEGATQPSGKLARTGYYGIGVVGAKNQANLGTLWRSAFQLGAAVLFTVGTRYKSQPTDTVHAISRLPLFELDDWHAFAEWAPRGAKYVAVEFGGTPLEEFEHPHNAIYLLGSEDAGLPNSVVRAAHEVVSLSSERYASYNVAVAGSLVMYDRQAKIRAAEAAHGPRFAGKGEPSQHGGGSLVP